MDIGFVSIKYHPRDPKDGPPIKDKIHSTFFIKEIISLRDWGQAPYEKKRFSTSWNPIEYTY